MLEDPSAPPQLTRDRPNVIPLWENISVKQTPIERLFIVEATNWKEAVIALLEPESPYTPWRCGMGEAEEGDAVAFVLNTDPASVLTELGRVGIDGDPARAQIEPSSMHSPGLVDLETLVMMTGFRWDADPRHEWVLHGEMAIRLTLALTTAGIETTNTRGSGTARWPRPESCCTLADGALAAIDGWTSTSTTRARTSTSTPSTLTNATGRPPRLRPTGQAPCVHAARHACRRTDTPASSTTGWRNIPAARRAALNRLGKRCSGC